MTNQLLFAHFTFSVEAVCTAKTYFKDSWQTYMYKLCLYFNIVSEDDLFVSVDI